MGVKYDFIQVDFKCDEIIEVVLGRKKKSLGKQWRISDFAVDVDFTYSISFWTFISNNMLPELSRLSFSLTYDLFYIYIFLSV